MKTRDIINYIKENGFNPNIDNNLIKKYKNILSNLIQNNNIDLTSYDGELDNLIALIYRIKQDNSNTIKYYMSAINNDYLVSAKNLAMYYFIMNDTKNAEYCIMLTDNNNKGIFFEDIGNYEKMEKYYLMTIEEGNVDSMFNLGLYYQNNEDNENMKNIMKWLFKKEVVRQ